MSNDLRCQEAGDNAESRLMRVKCIRTRRAHTRAVRFARVQCGTHKLRGAKGTRGGVEIRRKRQDYTGKRGLVQKQATDAAGKYEGKGDWFTDKGEREHEVTSRRRKTSDARRPRRLQRRATASSHDVPGANGRTGTLNDAQHNDARRNAVRTGIDPLP